MKYKATKKEVMERMWTLSCGYCEYQNILDWLSPNAYTCGVYGWNADIYELSDNIAIVTGYRLFGDFQFCLTDEELKQLKELKQNTDDREEYVYKLKKELKKICWKIIEEERGKKK